MLDSINQVAGSEVEITIRGERNFTFSFDCLDVAATQKIRAFFKNAAKKIEIEADAECGTFIYVDI